MPQLDISTYPGQLFWLFISFFFLWFVLHIWLVPRFSTIFEKRRKHIEQLLAKASTLQTHGEILNRQACERLEHVKIQAEYLIKQTAIEMDLEKHLEQEKCSNWLQSEREKTERVFDEIRQKALQDVTSLGPSLGVDLFNRLSKKDSILETVPQNKP
jgi:F-type H+-transporting ATPase subunit b